MFLGDFYINGEKVDSGSKGSSFSIDNKEVKPLGGSKSMFGDNFRPMTPTEVDNLTKEEAKEKAQAESDEALNAAKGAKAEAKEGKTWTASGTSQGVEQTLTEILKLLQQNSKQNDPTVLQGIISMGVSDSLNRAF